MAAPLSSSKKIKFHYGYGGNFKVCPNDAKLKYVGGTNKIMTVDRHITYTELIVKMWDICGPSMNLRCMLPTEDFYLLVHVTSDEDLKELMIRAILDPLPPLIIEIVDDYLGSKVAGVKFSGYPPPQVYHHADQAMSRDIDGFFGRKAEQCSFY